MISYREKCLWVSVLVSVVLAMLYADNLYAMLLMGESATTGAIISLVTHLTIAIIVLEIVMQVALAMDDQEGAGAPEDEREKLFRLKANDIGYWVLSIGVIACIVQQLINSGVGMSNGSYFQNIALAPIELKLITIFWISEVVRFISELFFYRKGS